MFQSLDAAYKAVQSRTCCCCPQRCRTPGQKLVCLEVVGIQKGAAQNKTAPSPGFENLPPCCKGEGKFVIFWLHRMQSMAKHRQLILMSISSAWLRLLMQPVLAKRFITFCHSMTMIMHETGEALFRARCSVQSSRSDDLSPMQNAAVYTGYPAYESAGPDPHKDIQAICRSWRSGVTPLCTNLKGACSGVISRRTNNSGCF